MPGAVATILIIYAVVGGTLLVIYYALQILYCLSAARCLKLIHPRNRQAEPGSVWLALIPCVGYVFHIITNFKLLTAIKNEFEDRGWKKDGDFGQLWVILELIGFFTFYPLWVAAFVMTWVKVAGYAKQFDEDQPTLGYDDDEDEEDDLDEDRPRGRGNYRRRYD